MNIEQEYTSKQDMLNHARILCEIALVQYRESRPLGLSRSRILMGASRRGALDNIVRAKHLYRAAKD